MKQGRKKKLAKELFKYGLAGVFNTMLGFMILYLQLEILHVNKYLANIINYSIGFFTNFYINRYWTFKSKGNAKNEIKSSILVYIFSFSAQFVFVYFISKTNMWAMNALSDLTYTLTPDFLINFIDRARFLRLTDPDLILMCCGIVIFAGFNFR